MPVLIYVQRPQIRSANDMNSKLKPTWLLEDPHSLDRLRAKIDPNKAVNDKATAKKSA